jgi:hypothetical protein
MKLNRNSWQMDEDESFASFEKKHKLNHRPSENDELQVVYQAQKEKGFTCIQCGFPVSVERELSGVNNRNHCPRCLWSRHVDLNKAGDRKADCRSRMQPIGLTVKQTHKRYSQEPGGELILIHLCRGCGKISINRIAADDDVSTVYQLFNRSAEISIERKELLETQGITLLGRGDLTVVYSQLFGWQSILEEFKLHETQANGLTAHMHDVQSEEVAEQVHE